MVLVLMTWLAGLTAARAQPAQPLVRADAVLTVGWLSIDNRESNPYDDWYNRIAHGGGGVGWYWTDHWKTELDAGASTEAETYGYENLVIGGLPTYVSSRVMIKSRGLALSQQYQFFRNAWFHPHVAAGLDWSWQTTREESVAATIYDPVTRQSRIVLPPGTTGPDTVLRVRPFGAVGFKVYMTPRAFFRSDARFVVEGGLDAVLWRFGLGVDF
jgi:hypothetical protein